jgi:hypothetical protein
MYRVLCIISLILYTVASKRIVGFVSIGMFRVGVSDNCMRWTSGETDAQTGDNCRELRSSIAFIVHRGKKTSCGQSLC